MNSGNNKEFPDLDERSTFINENQDYFCIQYTGLYELQTHDYHKLMSL